MRRGNILDAVVEAESLGLIHATRGVRSYDSRKVPSRYRLTWLGTLDGLTLINEWRSLKTPAEAEARVFNALQKPKYERAVQAATRADCAANRSDQTRAG